MSEIAERDTEFRAEVREALKEIRKDIRSLIGFRAWLLGASMTVSAIVSLAIEVLRNR